MGGVAEVGGGRQSINNSGKPSGDAGELQDDMRGWMKCPAGRSEAITNVLAAVLVPDVT